MTSSFFCFTSSFIMYIQAPPFYWNDLAGYLSPIVSQHRHTLSFTAEYILFRVRWLAGDLILVHIPLAARQSLAARRRGKTANEDILGDNASRRLSEELGQTVRLAVLLGSDELLRASLANKLDLGLRLAAHSQQAYHVGLVDDRKARVRAAAVALPVGVSGDIASRQRNGVFVLEGVVGAGGRQAEGRVERDTVGALGVEGEDAAERLPDTGGLDGVFLQKGERVSNGRIGFSRQTMEACLLLMMIFVSSEESCAANRAGVPIGRGAWVFIYLGNRNNAASGFGYRLRRHFVAILLDGKLARFERDACRAEVELAFLWLVSWCLAEYLPVCYPGPNSSLLNVR